MARLFQPLVVARFTFWWRDAKSEQQSSESLDNELNRAAFLWHRADANHRTVLLACVGIIPGDSQFYESLLGEFCGLDHFTQARLMAVFEAVRAEAIT
jgi:hypothetical protein